jgi:hypothetical protein
MNELTNIEIDRSIEQRMAFVLQNKYGQKPKTSLVVWLWLSRPDCYDSGKPKLDETPTPSSLAFRTEIKESPGKLDGSGS